ncbi:MAG: hydroxymethylglutaryl-CoA lyase [Rhodospirillales bacterium]
MVEKVTLREVGLRDGLQMIQHFMPTARKKAWIDAEYAAGLRSVEATSMVPPKLLPQLADAEEVIAHAASLPDLRVTALILNLKGAERGLKTPAHKLNYVVSVSDAHSRANVRRSTEEAIADFKRIVSLVNTVDKAKRPALGVGLATAFGCTIQGRVDEGRVAAIAAEVAEAGAEEIALADTVGYGDPAQVKRLVRRVKPLVGGRRLFAHFHNTRGLGLANVLAALEEGVRDFDASLGGLGGCPYAPGATGNVTMEDCVFMLEQMGFETGIDLARLLAVRRAVEKDLPGVPFYGDVARAGVPKTYRALAA